MTAKTALMIHGAGGGGWEWTLWERVFAAHGWRVVAPDLLPAASGLAATRLVDYEGQVRDWCVAAAPDLIVGASLGGLLALRVADAAPGARLVLVNALPPRAVADAPWSRAERGDVIPWRRDASLRSTARAMPDADPEAWHCAWRSWRDESGAVLEDAANADASKPSVRPALVVASGRDDDISPDRSRALARWLAADLLMLADASHVGPLLGRDAIGAAERVLAWAALRS